MVLEDEFIENEPDQEITRRRSEIEQAGIARVVEYESSSAEARCPIIMPPGFPGYDIESHDGAGEILRYIEVKSLAGDWGMNGIALSRTQFSKAREIGERYWLYVVEWAEAPHAQIHCIRDPARRVDQFLFDDGWRDAAGDENDSDQIPSED